MRREDRKVIAGVCAGLAYRLGVDPNVVRIVVIVLAFFGGAGVLLYVLGWLLLPEQRTGRPLAERAIRGGAPDGVTSVLLAAALTLVAVGFAVVVVGDNWFGLTVLVVAIGIGALLLTRQPTAPSSATPSMPASPPVTRQWPAAPPTEPPTVSAWDEPAPPRPRSVLGPLTLFSAIAALGVVGVVDAVTGGVPVSAYVAVPLAVVGAGLVVGAWFGRSRGLIAVGAVLAVLLVPVAAVETVAADRASDEPVVTAPTSTGQLDGRVAEYAAGDVRWDLTGVDFDGTSVDTRVSVVAGTLTVDLPPEVTLVLDASVGAGEIDVLGETTGGLGVSTERTFAGSQGGGTLNLDVQIGVGAVEVNRAQA